jgi:GNAT superfamily N-acetyltransferase
VTLRFVATNTASQVRDRLPRPDAFDVAERSGTLFVVLVYDDQVLVGHSINSITSHLHYADLVYAENHLLFASQAEQHTGIEQQLIAETERLAKAAGAQMLIWHAKQGTPLDSLLPRLGYGVQDILHSKEL